jgi:hypothetical protein
MRGQIRLGLLDEREDALGVRDVPTSRSSVASCWETADGV